MTRKLKQKHDGCDICHEPETFRTLAGWFCVKHWDEQRKNYA